MKPIGLKFVLLGDQKSLPEVDIILIQRTVWLGVLYVAELTKIVVASAQILLILIYVGNLLQKFEKLDAFNLMLTSLFSTMEIIGITLGPP